MALVNSFVGHTSIGGGEGRTNAKLRITIGFFLDTRSSRSTRHNPRCPFLEGTFEGSREREKEKGIDRLDEFGSIRRIETDEAIGRDRKDNDRTDDNRDNVTETDAH